MPRPKTRKASPNKKRTRRKDVRPEEILSAAFNVFADRGFAAATLDDVAKRAGIGKGTIYLYFSGKDELFKGVVRDAIITQLKANEQMAASHSGSKAQLLKKMIARAGALIVETRLGAISRIMLTEAGRFPDLAQFYVDEVIVRAQGLIAGIIREGIASGEFRKVNAKDHALPLFAPVIFLGLWRNSFHGVTDMVIKPAVYLAAVTDMLIDGLKKGNRT